MSDSESAREPPTPRRSFSSRLDTAGKKLLAVAGAVVVITGAVAGVRGLLPHSSPPANLRAALEALDIRVGVPLDAFTAQETVITAQGRGQGMGNAAIATPALMADAVVGDSAQSETPPASGQGEA